MGLQGREELGEIIRKSRIASKEEVRCTVRRADESQGRMQMNRNGPI